MTLIAPVASLSTIAPARREASRRARAKPALVRLFDATAMGAYPVLARGLGYEFRVGASDELRCDARAVVKAAWAAKGIAPPAEVAHVAERYDAASTWIVAYHRGSPVGAMGMLDMRIASIALDYSRRVAPPDLDLATTRELGRLAIVPQHRGGARTVMVGLLREMLHWSKSNGIERLFAGSTEALYRVYRGFNPTARLVDPPPAGAEPADKARYFEAMRAYGGAGALYTFEVAGASPWGVFSRFLTGELRSKGER